MIRPIASLIRAAAVLVAALFPFAALAQSSILQAGPWAAGHAPMYVGSGFGQTVVQDSGAASGGGAGVGLSELGLTIRASGTPPFANAGTGADATNFCDYDAPTTNATGYHFLCLSPNALGGGLIEYGAGGSASSLPFAIKINGTTYPFPFVVGGIVGPASAIVGDSACWNNTSGTLLKDCGNPPLLGPATTTTGHAALWNNAGGTLLSDAGFAPVQGPASAAANDGTCFNGATGTLLKDCGFPPIQGPATSTTGDTACWNNTTGTLTKDCGFPPFMAWGGTATGAVNTYAITANIGGALAYAAPLKVLFVANATNSGSATLAINSIAPAALYKDMAAPVLLVGGEITAASLVEADYDPALGGGAGGFHVVSVQPGTFSSLASASTVAIGGARSDYINITGIATISAFDSVPAGIQRTLVFAGALTLTNSATLILAGGQNIATAAGDTAIFRSEGGGTWRNIVYTRAAVAPAPIVRSYIAGVTLSNDGTSPNTVVDISAGQAADTSNLVMINIGAFTKSISGAWAAGSGSNGMGQGLTATASTWYDVCLANNSGTPDIYFDTATSGLTPCAQHQPTAITDTKIRRIGSIKLDGSTHILTFTQVGDWLFWKASVLDVNAQTLGTTATSYAMSGVPPGVNVMWRGTFEGGNAASTNIWVYTPLMNDEAAATTEANVTIQTAGATTSSQLDIQTDTSQHIRAVSQAASSTVNARTLGWADYRGRFN